MLTNYLIYSKIFIFQGSSFLSPAHGCGGARATMNFNNSPYAKKSGKARKQAGKKEGGWGEGIFARLPKRSPAVCSVRSRSQQKSFLSLLEEKIRRAQKKSRENFFAGSRALASGGGANQPFRSKKVRAKCKISPPIETSSFERIAPRGRVAAALRKMVRRFAANWLAGQKLKTADLFVSYLKTI